MKSRQIFSSLLLTCGLVLAGGCSDGDDANSDDCSGSNGATTPTCQLVSPTELAKAAGGNADYSCLSSQPSKYVPPIKDLVLRGKTQQRLSNGDDEDKGNVTVEVWTDLSDINGLTEAKRVAKTTSDAAGNYEVTIPAAAWTKSAYSNGRVAWRISANDTIPTVEFNDFLPISSATPDSKDPNKLSLDQMDRITLTRSTLQTINGLLGTTAEYDKQKAIVLGVVRDCKRQEVTNASAGLVDSSGEPIDGPLLYYFQDNFPVVRELQPFSSDDGFFTLLNVPVTSPIVKVRVVGKLPSGEQVISEQGLPVKSDTLIIVDFDPPRK